MAAPWQLNRAASPAPPGAPGSSSTTTSSTPTHVARLRSAGAAALRVTRGWSRARRLTAQGESRAGKPRFLPDGTLVYESADGQSQRSSGPSRGLRSHAGPRRSPPRAAPYARLARGQRSGFAVVDAEHAAWSPTSPPTGTCISTTTSTAGASPRDDRARLGRRRRAAHRRLARAAARRLPRRRPRGVHHQPPRHDVPRSRCRSPTAYAPRDLSPAALRAGVRPAVQRPTGAPSRSPTGAPAAVATSPCSQRDTGEVTLDHRRPRPRHLARVLPRRALPPLDERPHRGDERLRAGPARGAHAGRSPTCVLGAFQPAVSPDGAPSRTSDTPPAASTCTAIDLRPERVARTPGAPARSARPR
jgi:hypothetical protein